MRIIILSFLNCHSATFNDSIRNGPWTEEEKKLFLERYKEFFGKKGVPENTQWYGIHLP